MRIHSRILVSSIAVVVVLAASVGIANARRLEINSQFIRTTWSPIIFSGSGLRISCPLTIEGSFHSRTISKVCGQLIGYVTRAALTKTACQGGNALILNGIENAPGASTLPWHIRYNSFEGTLPAITGQTLQLIEASFIITGVECLFKATTAKPLFAIAKINAEGKFTEVNADPTRRIPKFAGGILCPAEGEFIGNGLVTVLGGTSSIFVRLVQ